MAEKMNKILHKRSVQPNELGNGPKLPDASILEYGEIAVNYGAGHEALSFKNNNDEVVSLRTDEYYQGKFNDVIGDIEATDARITDITTAIEENEEVLASAITDLDSRIKIIEENGSGCFDDENLGYQQSGFNYPVMKDDEDKLYVTVEWTDENTTYAPVTSTEDGLMLATDKVKLDSITLDEEGNIVNIDALSDKNLGYEQSGFNYPVMKDADNDKLYVNVEWQNTTYEEATSESDGLMSSDDKSKLDSITVENGKVTNIDAFNGSNLGYESNGDNYGVQKDENDNLFVTVNTEHLESLTNKSNVLDENSTDNQYPTSKAVYSAIIDNERTVSEALTDLDVRISELASQGIDEESVRGIVNNVITDLDSSAESSNGSFVNVKVEQADGLISNVTVSEQNIASTSDLETEKNARISGDTALQSNIDDEAGLREAGDAALQGKIDILNGTGDGSVDKKINDAFNDFATKLSDDNVVNTYKELIDYAATHSAEFTELVGTVTTMETAYQTADELLGARIDGVNNIIGDEFTAEQTISDVIIKNEEVTAVALTELDNRIQDIEVNGSSLSEESLGYAQSGYNYPVVKDEDGKLYVTVEWTDENTTYENATSESDGLMSSDDKSKLDSITVVDGIVTNINALSDENLGYNQSGYNYPVMKDNEDKLYVTVEWTDENTTYAPVTSTEDGLMSSTDKSKLDSIIVENGKVINVDALTDDNLGYETANGNYGIQKDDNGLLYVSVNTEQFETLGNKSETLSEESTHIQYPTSKAVYDVIVSNERVTAAGLSNVDERVKTLEKQMVENAVNEEAVIEIFNRELADFDKTVSGNSAFVTVSVSQTDGRISNVTVSDSGIASTAITDALDGRLDVIEGEGEGSIKQAVAGEATLRSEADEALDAKITILNADASTSGSVKNIVTTEIAKIVADAPEDLNTLKEIADYIASDKTHAAEINNAISNLESTLTGFDKDNTVGKKFEAIESSISDVRDIFGEGFSSGITVEKVITDNERVTAAALSSVNNRLQFIETNEIGFLDNNNLGYTGDPDTYAVEKDANNKLFVTVNTEHLEQTSNKSNVLDENSTDNQYPTSKAVYNYVNTIDESTAASLNALDGRLDVIEGEGEGSIKKAVAGEATLRSEADEALDAKIINLSAHVDEIDEGAAASLNTLNDYIKILEKRIASLEAKLAAITIEE